MFLLCFIDGDVWRVGYVLGVLMLSLLMVGEGLGCLIFKWVFQKEV